MKALHQTSSWITLKSLILFCSKDQAASDGRTEDCMAAVVRTIDNIVIRYYD